ncbi:hypothetical protein DFP72DRAFT_773175, partial [Ephemerocybe angulata]
LPAIHYSSNHDYARVVSIPTLANPGGLDRFPCIEAVFGPHAHITSSTVDIQDVKGKTHRFVIFYQQGGSLEVNQAIQNLVPGSQWRGSIIVMMTGKNIPFIGLMSTHRHLATGALQKYVL